jgi:C4-dicarboxylate transporter, DctQ subunit
MSLRAVFRAVQAVEGTLLSASILGIAGLTVVNVTTRTLFGLSLAAVEELSQVLILVVTFVGLSYAASVGRHIRMTALYDQLPEGARKPLMVTICATTSLLLAGLCVAAVRYVGTLQVLGTVSPALEWPLWALYLVAPLGLGLAAIQYALAVVKNLTSPGVWVSAEHDDGYESPEAGV